MEKTKYKEKSKKSVSKVNWEKMEKEVYQKF